MIEWVSKSPTSLFTFAETSHWSWLIGILPKDMDFTWNVAETLNPSTVKLGDKERFDKEQIGVKELFTDYQPFYTINLMLDKELLPI